MCRGEKNLVAARPEERAGRLADAGRDSSRIPVFEVESVDLVERVIRFAFALKHHRLSVRREVALPCAPAFEGELANVRKEIRLREGLRCRPSERPRQRARDHDASEAAEDCPYP